MERKGVFGASLPRVCWLLNLGTARYPRGKQWTWSGSVTLVDPSVPYQSMRCSC